jgi:hypothetical protein
MAEPNLATDRSPARSSFRFTSMGITTISQRTASTTTVIIGEIISISRHTCHNVLATVRAFLRAVRQARRVSTSSTA